MRVRPYPIHSCFGSLRMPVRRKGDCANRFVRGGSVLRCAGLGSIPYVCTETVEGKSLSLSLNSCNCIVWRESRLVGEPAVDGTSQPLHAARGARSFRSLKSFAAFSFLFFLFLLFPAKVSAQDVALKTNALYWATASLNLEAEVAVRPKFTLGLLGAYNPWTYKDDKKMRFWLLQPEGRYWFCEKFEGHFVGFHLHGGQYFGGFKEKRYDGYMAGFGFSYGYDWILSPHWNLELSLGLGYACLWYKESDRLPCLKEFERKVRHYVGPTKLSLSIVYIF